MWSCHHPKPPSIGSAHQERAVMGANTRAHTLLLGFGPPPLPDRTSPPSAPQCSLRRRPPSIRWPLRCPTQHSAARIVASRAWRESGRWPPPRAPSGPSPGLLRSCGAPQREGCAAAAWPQAAPPPPPRYPNLVPTFPLSPVSLS